MGSLLVFHTLGETFGDRPCIVMFLTDCVGNATIHGLHPRHTGRLTVGSVQPFAEATGRKLAFHTFVGNWCQAVNCSEPDVLGWFSRAFGYLTNACFSPVGRRSKNRTGFWIFIFFGSRSARSGPRIIVEGKG